MQLLTTAIVRNRFSLLEYLRQTDTFNPLPEHGFSRAVTKMLLYPSTENLFGVKKFAFLL